MDEKVLGLTMRCKRYFGLNLGQTLQEFAAEMRMLSEQEKEDLVRYFNEMGMSTQLRPTSSTPSVG